MIGNSWDVFRTDAFGLQSMLARIDNVPFVPGQVLGMNVFQEQSINTLDASFEERDNVITLIQTSARGSTGRQVTDQLRRMRSLRVPHLQLNDHIYADEILGKREFGTTNEFMTVEGVINRRLAIAARNLQVTLEHMCVTSLQGVIKNADGTTLLDVNAFFNITPETEVNFALTTYPAAPYADNVTGEIKKLCTAIRRKIQDNLLMGDVKPVIRALADPGFFDAFVTHPEVARSYDRWQGVASATGQIGGFAREIQARGPAFYWGDIWWEEYRGGTTFVPADKAVFFPIVPTGMEELYPLIYAPADYIETVNTLGRPLYSKLIVDDSDKFLDLEAQTNPLPVCTRPKALMMGRKA